MQLTEAQLKALEGDLDSKHVKARKGAGGMTLSYIEGWHAIHEANRIFGFGQWSSETVLLNVVHAAEGDGWKWGRQKGQKVTCKVYNVSYIAKVRVTVGDIVREGTGAGHGKVSADEFGFLDIGGAHESAIKEAETDARKRAFMQFGNKFGLALYDKEQRYVRHNVDREEAAEAEAAAAEEQVKPEEPKEKPKPKTTARPTVKPLSADDLDESGNIKLPHERINVDEFPGYDPNTGEIKDESIEQPAKPTMGEVINDEIPDFAGPQPPPPATTKERSTIARAQVTKSLDRLKTNFTKDDMDAYMALSDALRPEMTPEDWQGVLEHRKEWKALRAQVSEVEKLKNNPPPTRKGNRYAAKKEGVGA